MKAFAEQVQPHRYDIIIVFKFYLLHFFFIISTGSIPDSRAIKGSHFLFNGI